MLTNRKSPTRRDFLKLSTFCSVPLLLSTQIGSKMGLSQNENGDQRLAVSQLQKWEALGYGMFIHFGMSTYDGNELSDGTASPSLYTPDKLNVDQWISVAKEAGMKYAVLTTKHVSGFCLGQTECTNYNVNNSNYKNDVVSEFVNACNKYGIKPGFYYCSWDNHHRFGSMTPSDIKWSDTMNKFPQGTDEMAPFTSSMYQTFQTAQITELLKNYGPIMEMWVDIPGVLGPGYRRYLYGLLSEINPEMVIMMNNGFSDGLEYNVDYAWPSDLISMERTLPAYPHYPNWREIDNRKYYIPGEVCNTIGKEWFYVDGDEPRSPTELAEEYMKIRERGANLLLDVPPNRHGVIPDKYIKALLEMKRIVGIS